MRSNILYILVTMVLAGLLLTTTDPFMYWMPPVRTVIALIGVSVLMVVWVGLVLHDRPRDEREYVLRADASRNGYLIGVVLLTLAFVMQGLRGDIDPWISGVLLAMVIVKLFTRLYHNRGEAV